MCEHWCTYEDLPGRSGPCEFLDTGKCPCPLPYDERPCSDPSKCPRVE